MSVSQCRLNYHAECEADLNRHINMELYVSYCYQSMAYFFDRDNVALPGFARYFRTASDKQRENAEKLMAYQNRRGGRVLLQDVKKPEREDWGSGLDAMTLALQLEKSLYQSLLDLHKNTSSHDDHQMSNFLETDFMRENTDVIKEVGDYLTNLRRVGNGLGEYIFDKETLSGKDSLSG